MKKFIFLLTAILVAGIVCSCNPNPAPQEYGFTYNLNTVGDIDGHIDLTFPTGNFMANGLADVNIVASSDTSLSIPLLTLDEGMVAEDHIVSNTAKLIDYWVDSTYNIRSSSGSYYLHIQGLVKDNSTGIIFAVDKTLTNRPDSLSIINT